MMGAVPDARSKYLPILNKLLPLYPACMVAKPRLSARHRAAGHLIHGWFMRCLRGVEVLLLLGTDHAPEAAPLRRSIIEHVIALKWVATEGSEVLNPVIRGHALAVKRRLDALDAAEWTFDKDRFAAVIASTDAEARDKDQDHLLHFVQRHAGYGEVHDLPGYLAETELSHPTYESAIVYCDVDGGVTVRADARGGLWPVPFATTQMLDALIAVREAFEPKPWTETLNALLLEYRSVTNLVRVQDGLQPVDWDAHGLGLLTP